MATRRRQPIEQLIDRLRNAKVKNQQDIAEQRQITRRQIQTS